MHLTHTGMPRLEMTPLERLGLITSPEGLITSDLPEDAKNPSAKTRGRKDTKDSGGSDRKRERAAQKEIRKAYYRKSLQWHPDRWAGMGMYALPVQAAFELINEAYNSLTSGDSDGKSNKGSSGGKGGKTEVPEEAVFE